MEKAIISFTITPDDSMKKTKPLRLLPSPPPPDTPPGLLRLSGLEFLLPSEKYFIGIHI